MECMFQVGQKVVCVDDTCHGTDVIQTAPIKNGEIYIIRWVGPHSWKNGSGVGVRLFGKIRNPNISGPFYDLPFNSIRFRPLIDTTDQVAALAEMMRKAAKTQKVGV